VHDAVIDLLIEDLDVGMAAAAQIDTHGDGSDIEMLVGHHVDGFEDLLRMDQHNRASSDPVHETENIFMLDDDLYAQFLADIGHGFLKGSQFELFRFYFSQHDHGKQIVHDGLSDIRDIDTVFGHDLADARHDAYSIQTDYRNDETT
jgi:hypothetical protein